MLLVKSAVVGLAHYMWAVPETTCGGYQNVSNIVCPNEIIGINKRW